MDLQEIEKFLDENEEGKKFLQKKLDSYVSKGITSYRTKFMEDELPKLIDAEVNKRHPEVTEEQKRIKELEVKFQNAEKSGKRSEVSAKLLRLAQEKNIPQFLVDVSVGDDYDTSVTKLTDYATRFNETLSSEVEKRLEGRKGPVRTYDDTVPIDLDNLPLNDPDFYEKNHDRLEDMLKKTMK